MGQCARRRAGEIFWTEPPETRGRGSSDPLGLDEMRNALADKLVPNLSARVARHRDFYWTLLFIRWAEDLPQADRVQRFLALERLLKLSWAKRGLKGFSGVRSSHQQIRDHGNRLHYPWMELGSDQRNQGLYGAHIRPLRRLGLVADSEMRLVDESSRALLAGARPNLRDFEGGDWAALEVAVRASERGFAEGRFVPAFRSRVRHSMQRLRHALELAGWPDRAAWNAAARHLGAAGRYALLAARFCGWADEARRWFDRCVLERRAPSRGLPKPPDLGLSAEELKGDLAAFKPLSIRVKDWPRSRTDVAGTLADLHADVIRSRGYGDCERWLWREGIAIESDPGLLVERIDRDGVDRGDCRWWNAVQLMAPRKGLA